jgi:hypothetical protein
MTQATVSKQRIVRHTEPKPDDIQVGNDRAHRADDQQGTWKSWGAHPWPSGYRDQRVRENGRHLEMLHAHSPKASKARECSAPAPMAYDNARNTYPEIHR